MRKYMTFWAVLLTIFLIIVLSYATVILDTTPHHEELYVDLRAMPTYVKNGFESSYIDISDPLSEEWDLVFPPSSGEIKMNMLPMPDGVEQSGIFFSANNTIEEFTALIPFNISEEQYSCLSSRNFFQPGLYFAGIGENWEIYVNGSIVASEVFLNENNEITKFQSRRGVTIPFDKQYLRNGSNSIVIRIIGARSSKWTGLIYGYPFYLTDYSQVRYSAASIESVVLFTICVFLGVYHTLLFLFRRTDKYNLLFAGYAIMFGIYLLARFPTIYQIISDSKYVQFVEYGALYLFTFLLSAFFETLNLGKITKITMAYGSFCVMLAVMQLFCSIWFAYDLLLIWQLIVFVYMIYALSYVVTWSMIKQVRALQMTKRAEGAEGADTGFWNLFLKSIVDTESGNIFLLIFLVISVGIIDVLDAALIHVQGSISLSMSAFLGFLLCMAYIMAKKYANRYETTEQMNEALEGLVKERTAELEYQIRIADAASRSKSSFLSRTSHEIRTPMNAIIGMSELVLREDIPVRAYEHVLTIKQASVNLLSIINDILDFSKIESGKLEIVRADYLFSSLIDDVVGIIRMWAMDKNIRFTVNVDCEIPNAMIGDVIRIRQILLNLLSNAVKYTDEGFISLTATGKIVGETTAELTIMVSDSGRGIKEENVDKLFGEFVQVDQDKNRGIEGTGLGLAITKSLIKEMNGQISVCSEYGKGSTFTIVLPQEFREYEKLASVDAPEDLHVLIYERREVYSKSIADTIRNLGVEYELVTNEMDFCNKLTVGDYSHVFVSSFLYQNAKKAIANLGKDSKAVLLTEFGEIVEDQKLRILSMPVFSVSVANMLNGISDFIACDEDKEADISFVAPNASILVVDDINTNLKVVEGLLRPYGMRIDLCDNGSDAIKAVKSKRYDIIFMDHMMPEMDGIEAAHLIRTLKPEDPYYKNVPIVALTANAMSGMKEIFIENGFVDYITKPVEVGKLNEVISKWIPKEKQKRTKNAKGKETRERTVSFEIEGLDVKRGLSMSGGSEERYREILALYCRDVEERLDALREPPNESNLSLLLAQMHALKGASASIGATELSERADLLERVGKSGDISAFMEGVEAFHSELSLLTSRIKAEITHHNRPDTPDTKKGVIDTDGLLRLKEALEAEDVAEIEETLSTLSRQTHNSYGNNRLAAISDLVLISELKSAVEIIDVLLRGDEDE